ncbi:hypothetical protein ACEPPN_001313 [Leptodophora sp. 'Broadleaf-Isolate-01']
MGASMSVIKSWKIITEPRCLVPSNIGISGLLGRIAFAINPNAAILGAILIFLISESKSPSTKKLRENFTVAFQDITGFQLVATSAYLATALMNPETSWFHYRFLLDPAIQSCLAAGLLSLHFRESRRTSIGFCLHILNMSVFTGLFVWSGYVYLNKVAQAMESGCYDERFQTVCMPVDIILAVFVILLLWIPAFHPAKFKRSYLTRFILCVTTSLFIIADEYLSLPTMKL